MFTTHLAHHLTEVSQATKRAQLELSLHTIDEWADPASPTFFVGDFNSTEDVPTPIPTVRLATCGRATTSASPARPAAERRCREEMRLVTPNHLNQDETVVTTLGETMIARSKRVHRGLLLALLAALLAVPVVHAGADTEVATPLVSLPPDGIRDHALWDSWYELLPFGYEEQEYFVSGTASDGAGKTAAYTTRIIVTRPSHEANFNGTVLLDWTNVTAQFENAVDTMSARQMLMREGFAYVHVSAQAAGVDGTPLTPKKWDPVRYAALNHPGDAFANDMFAQVAKAIRSPRTDGGSLDPMGDDLDAQYILAAGQSQSASKLYSFVNTDQPGVALIDGFLIHGGGSKSFTKNNTKVLHLLSDSEANTTAPTADPEHYRLWEVAGTAHSDFFIGYQSEIGSGERVLAAGAQKSAAEYEQVMTAAGNYGEQLHPLLPVCVAAGATMPMHYAASSALYQLDQWVKTGAAPKSGPRFAFSGTSLAKDADGNTLGGIRMPPIDVPVARYESTTCVLGGLTVPFTDVQIQLRYPTHAQYYGSMLDKTDAAVRDGWLLEADAIDLMQRACAAKVRWHDLSGGDCGGYSPPAWNTSP